MASIQIIGGGAIGLLLAGRLAASGVRVCVRTRTRAQADELAALGVTVQSSLGEADVRADVDAAALDDEGAGPVSDTLLAVKQTALTPAFLYRLGTVLPPGASVTAFCNGIGHTDLLAAHLPGRSLFAAVTTEGALRVGTTTVRHTGRGEIRLGPAPLFEPVSADITAGDINVVAPLASMLKQAGFSATLSNDMAQRMLRKLLGNAVVNPLTSLLRVRNGELVRTPERIALMRTLFDETLSVLEALGLERTEGLWEELLDLCARTAANRSSMLQDVLAGRPTEIGAINGAVTRLAAQHGADAPYNESLVALVSAMRGEDREG
ncbi:ketopantoate reductase family protein [Cohnella hashimotonis]|uniref:2-dehydropantoate 2-reductase n=1 Tax=Cohnella hashimotonis TaxID=2826895 RepID=A0ABT6TIA5_9BACL|nr:2-dehydropantoate 2-reductase [Cohnella hashimotonis]MDI4646573.1 2-dehydropantoate 2-reductase [Cohnella hashimotonis]